MPRADRTSATRPERRPGSRRRAPSITTILLVRHGTTTTTGKELPGRAPGLHLADEGRRQADDVAARIRLLAHPPAPPVAAEPAGNGSRAAAAEGAEAAKPKAPAPPRGLPIAAVYASPLERTRETAAPIAAALGLDVRIDEGLIELDVGDWTGMELKAAYKRKEWGTIQRYPSGFTFPGGESFMAMQSRMVATLDRLRAAHPGKAVVAVSHADPIRAVVAHAMGSHLDLFQRVVVSPCSLTAIAYGDGGPMVLTVNATGPYTALVPS
jgi:broad specificity phosphatase PhoE